MSDLGFFSRRGLIMSWRRRAGGCAVALVLSVAAVIPVEAATNRDERTATGIQGIWENLDTVLIFVRGLWLGGYESATAAATPIATSTPNPPGDPDARRGCGGNGTAGETDGGPDYDPNGR